MNVPKLLTPLALIASISACASAAPSPADTSQVDRALGNEHTARQNSTDMISVLVAQKDTKQLSAMAKQLRNARKRTESGLSVLGLFHGDVKFAFTRGMTRNNGCMSPNENVAHQWLKEDPKEPAAIIAVASVELSRAWCERGGGFIHTVSERERQKFAHHAERAYALLDANREIASVDPEFYAVTATAYRAINASEAQLEALLDEATSREPYYMRTYFAAAQSYLPKWGGSYHDLDAFARYAAERTATSDKSSYYYRVYWSLENDCHCMGPWNSGDWETMKQAMRDLYERYPSSHNLNHILDVTCKAGDFDEALAWMYKKHPDATSDDDLVVVMSSCKHLEVQARAAAIAAR